MNKVDPQVLKLIDELDQLGKTRDDAWQVPRVEGELLYHIAAVSMARHVVEVGTSYGFSALFWGAALKRTGGVVHTVDIDVKKFDSARETFAKAGLSAIVKSHLGDGLRFCSAMRGPIDIVFLDSGDKRQNRRYFDISWPKLRPGGSILTDNAVTHRAEMTEFVKYVRSRPDATSYELPIGNGLEWTVKLG